MLFSPLPWNKKFTQSSIIRNEDVSWGVEVEIIVVYDVEATCTNFLMIWTCGA
jgi:hypothetical protein